ncbi:MAG: iron-sulfur cluster assembly scaffold protein [Planctomycetes bacterium]|nr:iron-sulfur cluster assembly scaffold protein [Planctomycetota bacterium]
MDHFQSPRNQGRMDDPDRVGLAGTPGQGPYLLIQVKIKNDQIIDVRFQSHGCGPTIASGSLLTELIQGKTLTECQVITDKILLEELGGLPPHKRHCVGYAVQALKQILKDDVELNGNIEMD